MSNDSSSRIARGLAERIRSAPANAQLPSTRELVAEYGASPVTVQKALRALRAEGLIETRPGVGTFARRAPVARPSDFGWQSAALAPRTHRIPRSPAALRGAGESRYALHTGYPHRELLPEALVRSAFARAARHHAAQDRAPVAGLPELQAWFATELARLAPRGHTPPAASDAIVIPGSQTGLGTTFHALVGAGRPLLVESPTYWGAIAAAARVGVDLIPVPSGPHGPDLDELERAFARTGARAFYAHPTYANPSGAQWSEEVADRVLELAVSHGAFIIEDDWAHDFGITTDPRPLAARDVDGHVVYLRSLTKSISPAVRVAGLIARGPARERILSETQAESMYVSGVLQEVALDVVTRPAWATHLRGLRQALRARRDLLADAVAEHAPQAYVEAVPAGGLNLWARLPDDLSAGDVAAACERRGLLVAPGDEWFPAEPSGPFLRLNYSGPSPDRFPDAARILGEVLDGRL
ncbi:PLP-dependent aminotransferase family protein [Microbacterium karelineae]|uniref:aminotransferase-like domain-containing protein n=1 Tax=Microbacterium karelineae TaxID=2654283 RepID=UPI0012EAA5B6|nr:PLP-dependent aminotransferase family protein [Microbacterium karelineae]